MKTEYEATFENVNKNKIRDKLKKIGASLVKKEFLMKRYVFSRPFQKDFSEGWIRVRDEGDKVTLSLKKIKGDKISNQQETCLLIDDLEKAREVLEHIGCKKEVYQENRREIWRLDNVEICIDEWPFLEPFVEIEGKSKKEVKEIAERLGFNWDDANFEAVAYLYSKKYGMPKEEFHKLSPILNFDKNPFENL